MNEAGGTRAPKGLDDLSHLFLSNAGEDNQAVEPSPPPSSPGSPSPSPTSSSPIGTSLPAYEDAVKHCLAGEGKGLLDGAVLVDDAAGALEDWALIFAGNGSMPGKRPVLVELLEEGTDRIPLKIYTRLDWLNAHETLFLRAYGQDGILSVADPLFLFVAPAFPKDVVRAAAAIDGVSTMLLQARVLRVNGSPGVLLRQVHPAREDAHFFPL